ncbi:MAG: glycine cleavage system protein GcvH [Synergistaceae bacterium]
MNFPSNLKYTASHEWVEVLSETSIKVGLTAYATDQLGDVVFINLPEVGDDVTVEESFSDIESVKAVSDIISPATGSISAINENLADNPGAINADPYEEWLVEIGDISELGQLLSPEEYQELLAKGA